MEHEKELQSFLDSNKGFEPDFEWAERVRNCHKDIRKLLGGDNYSFKYETDQIYKGIPSEQVQKIWDYLVNNCQQYLIEYNVSKESLAFERIKSTHKNSNNSHKWTKHIPEYFKRHSLPIPTDFNKFISSLGETYAIYKNKKISLYISIAISPIAFAMLGSFGPDNESCFKQSSQHNPHHKFILGQTPGTFVVLVSENPIELSYSGMSKNKISGRLWGIYDSRTEKVAICNWYADKNSPIKNTMFGHVPNIIQTWLGDEFAFKNVGPTLGVKNVYYNARGNNSEINLCFYKKNSFPQVQSIFVCNKEGMDRTDQAKCSSCGRIYPKRYQFDDYFTQATLCYRCSSVNLIESDLTGIKSTSRDVCFYIDENRNVKLAFKNEMNTEHDRVKAYIYIIHVHDKKLIIKKYQHEIRIASNSNIKDLRIRYIKPGHSMANSITGIVLDQSELPPLIELKNTNINFSPVKGERYSIAEIGL